MRAEIAEVVSFMKSLVKLKNNVKAEKIDLFGKRLAVVLQEKFEGHWYPENPSKGQAYRYCSVGHTMDPELLRACRESGIKYSDLGLPWEITLWVDPGETLNAAAPSCNPKSMRSGMGASNPQPHNRTSIHWRNKLWVPPLPEAKPPNGTPTINNHFFLSINTM
uniref:B-cell translocation gene 3 n=1 Tax=Gouania willdenowi TaxID=441366 RepID=A0A8C5NA40_GOUWI